MRRSEERLRNLTQTLEASKMTWEHWNTYRHRLMASQRLEKLERQVWHVMIGAGFMIGAGVMIGYGLMIRFMISK